MNVTISPAHIWAALVALIGIIAGAVKVVATRHLTTLDAVRAGQEALVRSHAQIVEAVQTIAEAVSVRREVDRLSRILAKTAPAAFICDTCEGWDGPSSMKPEKVKVCKCDKP